MPFLPSRTARLLTCTALIGAVALVPVSTGQAQQQTTSYGAYGTPGLVEMPTARMAPDAEIAATVSRVGDTTRSTLTFQLAPRLTGSFRYTGVANFDDPASVDGVYYDRSFDIRYQVLTEGRIRPSVAVGLQDFIGTGLFGGEYIVATKTLVPGVSVTGGVGWGRFGGENAFATTGTRPDSVLGTGGVPSYDQWFRGDMAAFGGLSYSPNDRLTFKVEYSSDSQTLESTQGGLSRDSSVNFGLDWRFRNGNQLSLYHAYGSAVGAQLTMVANPRRANYPGGIEGAPLPVAPRAPGSTRDLGWTQQPDAAANVRARLDAALKLDQLSAEGFELNATSARLRLSNRRYGTEAQAIGRAARAMTRTMPASVETFTIVPVVNGMAMSAVTLRRSDLEQLEHADSAEMLVRAQITDGYRIAPAADPDLYPKFEWSLRPVLQLSVFDPQNPVRADIRGQLSAQYKITPNLILSGAVAKTLVGNIADAAARDGRSNLPQVRTNFGRYAAEGDPGLEYLTIAHYGRPAPDFYSRVTLGYLESMFAGVSGEVLWKPASSALAFGAEMNYVQQRDFNKGFGLQDYDILTGHLSAYYDFGNGYNGQLDVGRYLAGDVGATISLDREFANGWRVGAYATFTDASAEDFGEGSFDKGLRVTVPLTWATGTPSRTTATVNLRSLTRDGGARLSVNGRLYGQVRDYHSPELAKSWGTFWR